MIKRKQLLYCQFKQQQQIQKHKQWHVQCKDVITKELF